MWPEPGTTASCDVRADSGDQPLGQRDVLRVERARDHQYGHVELAQPVPQRLLRAGAGEPEARGQSRRRVGQPGPAVSLLRRQCREEGLGQPLVDEALDPDLDEVISERVVCPVPRLALDGVVDAGARAHQHQPRHRVRTGQCRVQADAPAHRIADVGRVAPDRGHGAARVPQIGVHLGGRAMAGRVDQHQLVVGGQVVVDGRPALGGLREPVHQHDPARARSRGGDPAGGEREGGGRVAVHGGTKRRLSPCPTPIPTATRR